jgi:hypothetical protein
MMTSFTSVAETFALFNASLMAMAPSFGAGSDDSAP